MRTIASLTKVKWTVLAASLVKSLLILLVILFSRIFLRKRDLWLISERYDEARDNGYHLFRYVRQHYPAQEIYYVISPTASDYPKVNRLGNIIYWNTWRHYWAWITATCLISSQPRGTEPDPIICRFLEKSKIVTHARVYLKHGIVAVQRPNYLSPKRMPLDIIAAAAERERSYLVDIIGYSEKSVQLLGLCRFDELSPNSPTKRQILIMPTWRRSFRTKPTRRYTFQERELFLSSEYYRIFNNLLNSSKFHSLLESTEQTAIFYLHYGMQQFADAFSTSSSNIIVARRENYDIQTLLNESSVLVTDYSSVAFDFSYMGKPLVYLQPANDIPYAEHAEHAYYNYDSDGFGPVTNDVEEAVYYLMLLIQGNCRRPKKFEDRARRFFPPHDRKNCARTFQAILHLSHRNNNSR